MPPLSVITTDWCRNRCPGAAPCPLVLGSAIAHELRPSPAHRSACKMSTALPVSCKQLLLGNCEKSKRQQRMRGEQQQRDGRTQLVKGEVKGEGRQEGQEKGRTEEPGVGELVLILPQRNNSLSLKDCVFL